MGAVNHYRRQGGLFVLCAFRGKLFADQSQLVSNDNHQAPLYFLNNIRVMKMFEASPNGGSAFCNLFSQGTRSKIATDMCHRKSY